MPRHPRYPPYRTNIVSSGSKNTHKHMITIPKPIIYSPWSRWKVSKVKDEKSERLVWELDGYQPIVEYLSNKLAKLIAEYSSDDPKNQGDDCLLIQIRIDRDKDIHFPTSWHVLKRFENKRQMESNLRKHAKHSKSVKDKKLENKELEIKGLGKFNLNDLAIQFSLLDDFQTEYAENIELFKGYIRSVVNYNLVEPNYLDK